MGKMSQDEIAPQEIWADVLRYRIRLQEPHSQVEAYESFKPFVEMEAYQALERKLAEVDGMLKITQTHWDESAIEVEKLKADLTEAVELLQRSRANTGSGLLF